MAIRVMFYGLGPIGAAVARQVATRKGFRIVGGIDIDPAKAGRDLGEVIGLGRRLRVTVADDAARAISAARPDVAVLCTNSALRTILPQVEGLLRLKVPIVSTTEELVYPVGPNRRLARRIDALAAKAKVAVLATGVNPGFAMDALPIMLTGVSARVDRVVVHRVQDARVRRLPFQQKIGAGLTKGEFQRRVKDGRVRHVGLTESVTMIADAFGWTLDRVTDKIRPVVAEARVESEFLAVEAGRVSGLVQDGIGWHGRTPLVTLHMEAYLGAPESYDSVLIEGTPRIEQKITGGLHGDIATASMAVNAIPTVLAARPGLRTMRDTALPSYYGGK